MPIYFLLLFDSSTILRPLTDIATIESRLDVVELFLRNPQPFSEVGAVLSKFADLDKMLNGLCSVTSRHSGGGMDGVVGFATASQTVKEAKRGIDTLIYLKHSLELSPHLATSLDYVEFNNNERSRDAAKQHQGTDDGNDCSLLLAAKAGLRNPHFEAILSDINNLLSPSTSFSNSSHEMRHQECFAIRK